MNTIKYLERQQSRLGHLDLEPIVKKLEKCSGSRGCAGCLDLKKCIKLYDGLTKQAF
jgi:hypothetical protein